MIGAVTLTAIAVAFAGVFGMQSIRSAQRHGPLRVVFEGGSVSGLRQGGPVNFNGVPVGRITSIKLDSPRRTIVMVALNNTAPIRKDTAAGIEFQGLTGLATVSLVGGAPSAPPVPVDQDGIPVLTADLSDAESIVETLHNVDSMLVSNESTIKDDLRSLESNTAGLNAEGAEIGATMDQVDNALAALDRGVTKIEDMAPGLVDGKADELLEKLKSLRESSDAFKEKSARFIDSSSRTLRDVSSAAKDMSRKFDPEGTPASRRPPRGQAQQ